MSQEPTINRISDSLSPHNPELAQTLQATVDRVLQALRPSVCLMQVAQPTVFGLADCPIVGIDPVTVPTNQRAAIERWGLQICAAFHLQLTPGQPLILSDAQAAAIANQFQEDQPWLQAVTQSLKSIVIMPLYHQQHRGTLMLMQCDRLRDWSETDLAVAGAIAEQTALMLATLEDQQKQLQPLTERLDYYEALVEAHQSAAIDAVLVTHPTGRILRYNRPFAQLWHLPPGGMKSWSVDDIMIYLAPLLKHPQQFADQVAFLYQHPSQYSHNQLTMQDGRIIDCHSSPVYVTAQQPNGRVWYFRDVSKYQWAEEEIGNALQRERELNRLRNQLVSMVSHEFRTPLSTILSSAELLEHYSDRWPDGKKLRHLQRIQTAVQHMSQVLDDILMLGQGGSDRLTFNPTDIDLVAFCQELVEELQTSTHRTCQIVFQYTGTPESVQVDRKLLRHILTNLLSNAIKYSPLSEVVWFELGFEASVITLRIRDQGIGIPQADQEHLFTAFHRGSNVGEIPGTGLGLAVVQQCVRLHRGRIEVESEVERGTTFTVMLPNQEVEVVL